jgi:hypothetical protein
MREMKKYELDRLFGLALTDARFFQHLREEPEKAIARFALTESETRAVLEIAPNANSIEDLAVQLDSWMTHKEPETVDRYTESPLIAIDDATSKFSLSDDLLLKMVRKGKIRLSQVDVYQLVLQMSEEYA